MNYKDELARIYDTDAPVYESELLNKKIILYGAGSLGHMAIDLFQKVGIKPEYLLDKKRTGSINEIPVYHPDTFNISKKDDYLILICVSSLPYNEILFYLKSIGAKNIMHFYTYFYLFFPDILSNGWFYYNYTQEVYSKIEEVCEMLSHDPISLSHYMQFLWWKLRGIEKCNKDFPVLSGKKFFYSPFLQKFSDNESFLDCGCHFGNVIADFINVTDNKFNKIYAIEPDLNNLSQCMNKYNDQRIVYHNIAVSDFDGETRFSDNLGYASKLSAEGCKVTVVNKIDTLDISPTIIKLHIEGEELNALKGANNTITKYHPILMILADHNIDGLYNIPLTMRDYSYKLYFGLHDYCGNSAIFYGIKNI